MAIQTKLEDMQIGDKIICAYSAPTANTFGEFIELGVYTTLDNSFMIPPAAANVSSGYFHWIMVGTDFKGRKILVADRNLVHSISWDSLNTAGVATKGGVPVQITIDKSGTVLDPTLWKTHIRLLTGGTSDATKSNSEWDKYIVNSTLGGTITTGDNATWNWSSIYSWTSTTRTSVGADNRTLRGSTATGTHGGAQSSNTNALYGFRPVLVAESLQAPITNKYLFQDGEEIKKYVDDTINPVPTMTGYTVNGVTISASSEYDTTYPAWKAFNGTASVATDAWLTGSGMTLNQWIRVDFGTGISKIINSIIIQARNNTATDTIRDWVLEGSLDGIVWTIIHTVSGETVFASLEKRTYQFTNNNAYQYYRIKNTTNLGSGNYVGAGEIQLLSVEKGWMVVGPAPATKSMFDTDGMTDLSIVDDAAIQSLTSQSPELLCWTDEVGAKTYSSDIVPAMTANNTPNPFVISASNEYYPAYKVFNDLDNPTNNDTGWVVTSPTFASPEWLQIDLGQSKVVGKYTLRTHQPTQGPKNWTFKGSNDNATWFDLDTQVNASYTTNVKKEFVIASPASYRYYKIEITAMTGTDNLRIEEMELLEVLSAGVPSRTTNLTAIPHPTLLLPVGDVEIGEVESVKVEADAYSTFTENVIPAMTSNTSPSGIASASNEGFYKAWKAFDRTSSEYGWLATFNSASGEWIGYEFSTPRIIQQYTLKSIGSTGIQTRNVKSWKFQAYNGVSWITLDERINQPTWIGSEKRKYEFGNSNAYTKYRIFITQTQGDAAVAIEEIEMMEAITGNNDLKLLVSGDSGVSWKGSVQGYSSNLCVNGTAISGGDGTNYLAANAFNNDLSETTTGMWSSSQTGTSVSGSAWIGYDFGINNERYIRQITFKNRSQDFRNITSVKIQKSDNNITWTDVLTATLTITPDELQVIEIPTPSSARYWRLLANANPNGSYTWSAREIEMRELTTEFQVIDSSDLAAVKSSGLSPSQLNALSKEELKTLFPGGTARFAFYLEQEKSTDMVEVQSLKVNEKQFTLTPEITSLSVLYDLLKSERPQYYVSRNDGATWKEVEPDQLTKLDDLPSGKQLRVKAVLQNGQELHGLSYSWI
jgi:F5/8 type C domain